MDIGTFCFNDNSTNTAVIINKTAITNRQNLKHVIIYGAMVEGVSRQTKLQETTSIVH